MQASTLLSILIVGREILTTLIVLIIIKCNLIDLGSSPIYDYHILLLAFIIYLSLIVFVPIICKPITLIFNFISPIKDKATIIETELADVLASLAVLPLVLALLARMDWSHLAHFYMITAIASSITAVFGYIMSKKILALGGDPFSIPAEKEEVDDIMRAWRTVITSSFAAFIFATSSLILLMLWALAKDWSQEIAAQTDIMNSAIPIIADQTSIYSVRAREAFKALIPLFILLAIFGVVIENFGNKTYIKLFKSNNLRRSNGFYYAFGLITITLPYMILLGLLNYFRNPIEMTIWSQCLILLSFFICSALAGGAYETLRLKPLKPS